MSRAKQTEERFLTIINVNIQKTFAMHSSFPKHWISLLLLLTFLCFLPKVNAQYSISGSIKDAASGEALPFASVHLVNSTIGTTSGSDGQFTLDGVPSGKQELVFSYLGYKVLLRKIAINESSAKRVLEIKLQVAPLALETIEVKALSVKKQKRYLKKFTKAFFGQTINAGACVLLNPEVLHFKEAGQKLIVEAEELIEVENRSTGYRLRFYLEKFTLDGQQVTYVGKPLFEELLPASENEKANWDKRRSNTYLGSARHFQKALVNHQLKEEGFKIFLAQQKNSTEFHNVRVTNEKAILKNGKDESHKLLTLNAFLKVVYLHKKTTTRSANLGNNLKGLGRPAEKDLIQQTQTEVGNLTSYPTSYLFSRKAALEINQEGHLSQPEYLLTYGDWAKEGIADLLPYDYLSQNEVSPKANQGIKKTPKKKGFILSDLRIPLAEIKDGGPPKDGIPAIDQAIFLASEEVTLLQDHENVLGVFYNEIAKAYPIKIMDRHEVVNDHFGKTPVAITFCPLCASGIGILSKIANQNRSFGVSGLLYNSDVLLYDRETQSLWSQIKGQAISGASSGSRLSFIPTEYTTWGEWKKRHPQSKVLSQDTGFPYDYQKKAYGRYLESPELIFPVTTHSSLLNNKDKVIGITINGKFKAYAFKQLAKKQSPLVDEFNGQVLSIFHNPQTGSARIENQEGKVLNGMTMFWFAWYAFHPDTEVYY